MGRRQVSRCGHVHGDVRLCRSIELNGTTVQPDSRRWHHSLGNALWHTDSSYHQQRSKYSLLLSHDKGPTGNGWTHFADTRRAYKDLPEAKKQELEDLIVEHECVPALCLHQDYAERSQSVALSQASIARGVLRPHSGGEG